MTFSSFKSNASIIVVIDLFAITTNVTVEFLKKNNSFPNMRTNFSFYSVRDIFSRLIYRCLLPRRRVASRARPYAMKATIEFTRVK